MPMELDLLYVICQANNKTHKAAALHTLGCCSSLCPCALHAHICSLTSEMLVEHAETYLKTDLFLKSMI